MRLVALALVLVLLVTFGSGPQPAGAEQPAKLRRIGLLSIFGGPLAAQGEFARALGDLGYVEGRDFVIEPRYLRNPYDQLPAVAAELVRHKVDVIVTLGTAAAQAARRATSTIPIVMMIGGDPVGAGLATSLARPGGNVTGVSLMAPELAAKRLELLKEIAPRTTRVGVLLGSEIQPLREPVLGSLNAAAAALGVELHPIDVRVADELPQTFARLGAARADAIFVFGALFLEHKERLVELAHKRRLPAVFFVSDFVDAGGLMSFGASYADAIRRAAIYVGKILKGARPGDLPIEQAVRFELVLNLGTAKSLGLTVPQALLLRADRVIE